MLSFVRQRERRKGKAQCPIIVLLRMLGSKSSNCPKRLLKRRAEEPVEELLKSLLRD